MSMSIKTFTVTPAAALRIVEISGIDSVLPVLRVSVEGGGCSGFQYKFTVGALQEAEDYVFLQDKAAVLVDKVSIDLLEDCILDYEEDLGSASFVIHNPNAKAKCGCGNSFSII